jgi:4-amino-4-deoxy-L-arabinose transferase-like glycosyltransferase
MMRSEHRRAYLIILLITLCTTLVVALLPFKAQTFGDDTFHVESKNMALFLKGALPASQVAVTKAPGPVIFFTTAYLFAPADASDRQLWHYGVVMNTILLGISLLLLYKTSVSLFSRQVAVLTVLLLLLFPIHSYYSFAIMAEVPAFFCLSLALYGWSRVAALPGERRGWILIVSGITLLTVTRPNALLLLGVAAVILGYSYFVRREFFRSYSRQIMVSIISVLILGFSILAAAKSITGGTQSDSQDNLLYYVAHQGRFQFRNEPLDFRFWDGDIRPDSQDYKDWKASYNDLHLKMSAQNLSFKETFSEFVISDALAHPFITLRQFAVKAIYGHVYIINSISPEQFSYGPFKGRFGYSGFLILVNLVNILIILGAAIFFVTQKDLLTYWLFWGVIAALLFFHGLTYMEPRYMFPSKAALCIISAAGLYKLPPVRRLSNELTRLLYPKNSAHD